MRAIHQSVVQIENHTPTLSDLGITKIRKPSSITSLLIFSYTHFLIDLYVHICYLKEKRR